MANAAVQQQAMEQAQAQGWLLSALNTPADVMRIRTCGRGFDGPRIIAGRLPRCRAGAAFLRDTGELRRPPLLGSTTW